MIDYISTEKAPKAIGPYSQGISAGDFVFCSGQIPLHPETGEIVGNNIKEQTTQSLKNLFAVLEEAGSSYDKVVKTTVLLASMDDFMAMNEVYADFFKEHKPARAAFAVKTLPKNVLVEIECIAVKK